MTNNLDMTVSTAAADAVSAATLVGMLRTQSLDQLQRRTAEAVRKRPADTQERWLLFQLLCIDGEWNRALKQLQTWATLEPAGEARAQLHRGLIQSELFRIEVFAGRRTPGFIAPAPAWVETLLQANARLGAGDVATADTLRRAALEQAPASPGESPEMGAFAWLAESDTRLGPVCEMAVAGGYRWIPFEQMQSLTFTPAGTLTDLVWRPATAVLRDATILKGYLPTRYVGSDVGPTPCRLARETSWTDVGDTGVIGLGQKTWSTDQGDWGLLDLGSCRFAHGNGDAAA